MNYLAIHVGGSSSLSNVLAQWQNFGSEFWHGILAHNSMPKLSVHFSVSSFWAEIWHGAKTVISYISTLETLVECRKINSCLKSSSSYSKRIHLHHWLNYKPCRLLSVSNQSMIEVVSYEVKVMSHQVSYIPQQKLKRWSNSTRWVRVGSFDESFSLDSIIFWNRRCSTVAFCWCNGPVKNGEANGDNR